jgi:uncharacterized DUF497 family protein
VVITWDEPKRLANLDKHGMDFAALSADFFADALIIPAREGRCKAVGELADGTLVVIFALLGSEAISLISMRPANQRERRMLE